MENTNKFIVTVIFSVYMHTCRRTHLHMSTYMHTHMPIHSPTHTTGALYTHVNTRTHMHKPPVLTETNTSEGVMLFDLIQSPSLVDIDGNTCSWGCGEISMRKWKETPNIVPGLCSIRHSAIFFFLFLSFFFFFFSYCLF